MRTQLKPYPFFVSDAIPSDIEHTLNVLAAAPEENQRKVAGEQSARRCTWCMCTRAHTHFHTHMVPLSLSLSCARSRTHVHFKWRSSDIADLTAHPRHGIHIAEELRGFLSSGKQSEICIQSEMTCQTQSPTTSICVNCMFHRVHTTTRPSHPITHDTRVLESRAHQRHLARTHIFRLAHPPAISLEHGSSLVRLAQQRS